MKKYLRLSAKCILALIMVREMVRKYAPKVYAFGSRALANSDAIVKHHADLDLMFDGPELTIDERFVLRGAFSDSDLPMRVDVMDAADIPKTWTIRTCPV